MWTSVLYSFRPLGDNCALDDEQLMNGVVAVSAGMPGVGPEVERTGHKPPPAQIYGLGLMASASTPAVLAHPRSRRIHQTPILQSHAGINDE